MNTHRGRRRRITKTKLIRGIRGSISILLCLLLTPFLSIAIGLTEYARYQEALEITDEIYELTAMSALSDYDKYIHERFGLLAASQESPAGTDCDTLSSENAGILGKQISVSNPSVSGKWALTNSDTLRKQIIDFSELTVTTAVIAEDFKLEELINKLQSVSQFNDIMNTVKGLAGLTDSLSDAVDALKTLQDKLKSVVEALSRARGLAQTLSENLAELAKKLGENNITLAETAQPGEIDAALAAFCDEYLDDLKDICIDGQNLVKSLNDAKSGLNGVKSSFAAFSAAVEAAESKSEGLASSNSADSDGSISGVAKGTLQSVLEQMKGLVNSTFDDFKEDAINNAKQVLSAGVSSAFEATGLADFLDKYDEIIAGTYFSDPLSESAKNDLTGLLKSVGKVYAEKNTGNLTPESLLQELTDYFKSKFAPSLNFDDLAGSIQRTLVNAESALKDKVTNRIVQLLTKLVNLVKDLFDLDLFYESDMNAYVNISSASDSPYQEFLDAVGNMFTAVDEFARSISTLNLVGALKAVGKMFGTIGKLFKAIFDIVGSAVTSIVHLGQSIVTGDVRKIYEKFLISGYMRHNLPCRLDSGTYSSEYAEGALTSKLNLKGEGLTGMTYDEIARPEDGYIGQSDPGSGFLGLADTIRNLQAGHGSDRMFKGAELEYINAGTNSEIANQVITFFNIYFLRLLLDLPSVFMDGQVSAVATVANIASWVVYILYIIAEPFLDTLLLVNSDADGKGGTVPFIRTKCWLTASNISNYIDRLLAVVARDDVSADIKNSMTSFTSEYAQGPGAPAENLTAGDPTETDYRTTMLIVLLVFVDDADQISRLANLIELETAEYYRQRGKPFEMGKTYTAFELGADITFHPFFDLGLASGGSSSLFTKRITQFIAY